jgi:serine/threonine protein kinase
VLRLMRGGSLQRALQDPELHDALAWHNRGLQVATDIAEALHFLHGRLQLMHSDLSGANVLLDEDLRAYISDFGVARVVGQSARSVAGFHWVHAAPEQLLGERCSYPADMYSFGLLLIQLTTHAVAVKRGEWRLPLVPHECSQSVLELIEQCVASDPRQRPTAAQALERLRVERPGAASV